MSTIARRPKGTWATYSGSATGLSDKLLGPEDVPAIAVHVVVGTSGSLTIEQSINDGTTWITVGSAITTTSMTTLTNCIGLYRLNVSANGGTLTIYYQMYRTLRPGPSEGRFGD